MEPPATLELKLLGRFSARLGHGERALVVINSPRRRALLAYLAMQPGFMETRERLAALLWGEVSDRQARHSLRQALVALRDDFRSLGAPPLIVTRDCIGIQPGAVSVDARTFLQLQETGEIAGLERAAAIYNGTFFDGDDLQAEGAADWLREQRLLVEAAAAGLFRRLAGRHEQAGNLDVALHYSEKLMALDQWSEEAHRLQLRLLVRARGRQAALAVADAFAKRLHKDIGVRPQAETLQLTLQIKAGALDQPGLEAEPANRAVLAPEAILPDIVRSVSPVVLPTGRKSWQRVALFGSLAAACAGLAALLINHDFRGPPVPQAAPVEITAPQPTGEFTPGRAAAVSGSAAVSAPLAASGRHTVVVLPIAARDDLADNGLADRLTDDLINDLSRVPAIRIVARSTSESFRNSSLDAPAIAASLGVRYAVEATIRSSGSDIRVNASLIDARTRLQLWSNRINFDRADSGRAIENVVRSVARQLHLAVMQAAEDRVFRDTNRQVTVEDLVARGWGALLRLGGWPQGETPEDFFRQVLERDPGNLTAILGMGGYYTVKSQAHFSTNPDRDIERAKEFLHQSLAANPENSLAHFYMASLSRAAGDNESGRKASERALSINPSFAPGHAQLALFLLREGKAGEALQRFEKAVQLSPKDPQIFVWHRIAGQIEIERGNLDAAHKWFVESLSRVPRSIEANAMLAAVFALLDKRDDAVRHFNQALKSEGNLNREKLVDVLIARIGRDGKQDRLVEGLKHLLTFPEG